MLRKLRFETLSSVDTLNVAVWFRKSGKGLQELEVYPAVSHQSDGCSSLSVCVPHRPSVRQVDRAIYCQLRL